MGHSAKAQFATTPPVQDGTINAGEYGANGGTWSMSWDDNKLYIAKTGGNYNEPVYVYLDIDPLVPVNGGGNNNGNLTGTTDFSTTPSLPMRADVRIYWTGNYIEYKLRDNNGNWGAANTGAANVAQFTGTNGGTNREMFIRWNALPGLTTRPAAFNWLGYEANLNSPYFIYDQTPGRIASGANGNTPYLAYYSTVSNTSATGTTNPFGQESYTFPMGQSNNSFGGISVYDFTMNSAGQQISRGTTAGNWNIGGTLVVGAGSLYFGSGAANYGTTSAGNIQVVGGLLDMDNTNRPLNVTKNVLLTGGTFKLSAIQGGDLAVGGNFTVTGSTFQPFNRLVSFNGTGAQTLSNVPNGTAGLVFDYLTFDNATGPLALGSNITVTRDAAFTNGVLNTGTFTVLLDPANSTLTESSASYINGLTQTSATLGSGGSSTNNLHGIGLSITPQNMSAAPGLTTVRRTTGTTLTGANSNQSISRYFTVTPATTTGLDFQLVFAYLDHELSAAQAASKSTLVLFASATGAVPFQNLGGTSNTSSNTVTRNDVTDFPNASRVFTLGSFVTPLPVELVSFAARPTGNAVRLSWRTAQEVNSLGFGVEYQTEAGPWKELTLVPSRGNSGASYEYLDVQPTAKAPSYRYYRLRLADLDGTSTYSPVAAVKLATGTFQPAVQLSPVPAGNALYVTIGDAQAAEIRVYDMQGKLVCHAEAPTGTATVPVGALVAGVYVVEAHTATGTQRLRFVKE